MEQMGLCRHCESHGSDSVLWEASRVRVGECHELIQGVKVSVCSVENRVEGQCGSSEGSEKWGTSE